MENSTVERHDIETALWQWSGWTADQRAVDAVLMLVDRYAQAAPAASDPLPCAHVEPEPEHTSPEEVHTVVQGIPERSFEDGGLVFAPQLSAEAYRDPDGVLWLRLGSLPVHLLDHVVKTRKCTRCGEVQPLAWFNKDCNSRGGHKAQCKTCENETRAERRQRGKEKAEEVAA